MFRMLAELEGEKIGNKEEIVKRLRKAYADEWLAVYQYTVAASVVRGFEADDAVEELTQHAEDELRHAGMLSERLIQLGSQPILDFNDLMKMTDCGFEVPTDKSVKAIMEQSVKSEGCAIRQYRELLKIAREAGDVVTAKIVKEILADEVGHERDFYIVIENIIE